jgi:hypothetical protein
MTHADRADMVIIGIAIDALIESARRMQKFSQLRGDDAALQRIHELENAIRTTRRKFFPEKTSSDVQISQALIVAEGLREAARQCTEGQAALHARLIVAADTIERLCRARDL